jgi:hypothetical protein
MLKLGRPLTELASSVIALVLKSLSLVSTAVNGRSMSLENFKYERVLKDYLAFHILAAPMAAIGSTPIAFTAIACIDS